MLSRAGIELTRRGPTRCARLLQVTAIAIEPPAAAADCPRATPELLAATLARYSRSADGVRAILARVDPAHPDAAVESIFRFVDYGHASIGGLTGGIALAADGVSMLAAYRLFNFCQQADGQESSSRYIKLDPSAIPAPGDIGIPVAFTRQWREVMEGAFAAYAAESARLEAAVAARPELAQTPAGASPAVAARFAKNYALDRARYFLPFATRTNVALVQSARAWTETIRHLASSPLPEEQRLAELYRAELAKFAPRLIKHSTMCPWSQTLQKREVEAAHRILDTQSAQERVKAVPELTMAAPEGIAVRLLRGNLPWTHPLGASVSGETAVRAALGGRPNRYGEAGLAVRAHVVEVRWTGMAIAELRDLNRHRTGFRHSPLTHDGFYVPPAECEMRNRHAALLKAQANLYRDLVNFMKPTYGYSLLLGSQTQFLHSTHLDKFVYELELRTATGSHFRYDEHMRAAADELFRMVPGLQSSVNLGQK